MIKNLRRKFIIVTLISVTIVLLLVDVLVNVLNYRVANKEMDLRMSVLMNNEADFDRQQEENDTSQDDKPDSGQSEEMPPEDVQPGDDNKRPEDGRFRDFRNDIVLAPGQVDSFFSVTFSDGKVKAANCMGAKDMESDDAKEMAKSLYDAGEDYGFYEDWKYAVYYDDDDSGELTYIFLNAKEERDSARNVLLLSILLSVGAEILVLIMVAGLSKLVTAPVAESYEKQKRFITDASHELKTPIAIIKANTEVMEITSGESEWTESNMRQVDRLSNLIEKLVFLSRMDEENQQYLNMTDFDLSQAISEVADGFEGIAAASGKELSCNVEEGIVFHGDEGTLRQMISLLLDNAFKYASEGGCVSLSVTTREQGKNKILIEQTNPVDEIEKGNLDVLFERFYRPDESRNSEKGGHGIGLSVVRAIVLAHKGEVHADSPDGKSIRFVVKL